MLAALERSHAGVGLVPDTEIEQLPVATPGRRLQDVQVSPVHEDEVDRPIERERVPERTVNTSDP